MQTQISALPPSGANTTSELPQGQFKLMLSKNEAAEMISVSVRTIENLIANKELPVRRIGKRVLIPYRCLVEFSRHDHQTGSVQ
jgi:excisionase family DNA binding protein